MIIQKKMMFFYLLLFISSQSLLGQSKVDSVIVGKSRIVLIRPNAFAGDLTAYKIFDKDNNLLTKLKPNRPYSKIVSSGEYLLKSRLLRETTYKIHLESNKTYIIRFTVDGSPLMDKPKFRLIKVENSFQKSYELDSLLLK